MEAEVRGYKGTILELEGITVTKCSFDRPRVAYYRVKLYDADKKVTIDLSSVDPKEINVIDKK